MGGENKVKKIEELLRSRWEALPALSPDGNTVELQKKIVAQLSNPKMKPLLYRMIEDPEDHEDLMRELIQGGGLSEPEPYDVFRNTVFLVISLVRASIAESMREKNLDSALSLTEQATSLAVKIQDMRTAEECWLQLNRMAAEIGLASPALAKMAALRISEIMEKAKIFDAASEYVRVLRETAEAEGDSAMALNLCLRTAEILRKSEQRDEAEKLFKKCINEAEEKADGGLLARGWLGLARISNAGDDLKETARLYNNALEESTAADASGVIMETASELGLLLAQMENYESSWDVLGRALNSATGAKDMESMSKIVSNMWYACENLKKWGDYLVSLRTVRHFLQAEERNDLMGPVLLNFGRVHAAIGNKEEAKRHLDEAREALEPTGDQASLIEVDQLMGILSN